MRWNLDLVQSGPKAWVSLLCPFDLKSPSLPNLALIYLSNFLFQCKWLVLFLGTIISIFFFLTICFLCWVYTKQPLICNFLANIDAQVQKFWNFNSQFQFYLPFTCTPCLDASIWIFNQTNLSRFNFLLSLIGLQMPIFLLNNCWCLVQCFTHCCLFGHIFWLLACNESNLPLFSPHRPFPTTSFPLQGRCRNMTKGAWFKPDSLHSLSSPGPKYKRWKVSLQSEPPQTKNSRGYFLASVPTKSHFPMVRSFFLFTILGAELRFSNWHAD